MKRKVKTAAALLAVMTLAAAIPAASYANDGNIKIYAAKDADTRGTNDNLVVMAYNPLSNTPGNCRYAYWDFDLAELFEKMPQDSFVQSVTFHTRSKNFYHSETGINFWNITENWDENTLNFENQPLCGVLDKNPKSDTYNLPERAPDYSCVISGKKGVFEWYETDITPLFNKAAENGGAHFSFAAQLFLENADTTLTVHTVSKESPEQNGAYIQITLAKKTGFFVTETSPENGSVKADPKGGMSVTFSSEIKDISPSDIIIKDKSGNTVPLSSGDITRDGNRLFISKRLKPYEGYGVTLSESITDVGGNALCGMSFSFATRCDALSLSIPVKADASVRPQDSVKNVNYGFAEKLFANKGAFALLRLDFRDIPKGKPVYAAELSFAAETSGKPYVKLYAMPDGWDESTVTYESLESEYGADFCGEQIGSYRFDASENSGIYTDITAAADITDFVRDCIEKNLSQAAIGIACEYVFSVYSRESAQPPELSVTCDERGDIKAVSSDPENGGVCRDTERPVVLTLSTDISESAQKYIKLLKQDGSEVISDFKKEGRKITITPQKALDVKGSYKIVLKKGFADIYGSTIESDKTIITFLSDGEVSAADDVRVIEAGLLRQFKDIAGHPYIFGKTEDFKRIREEGFGKNDKITAWYRDTKNYAKDLLNKDTVYVSDPSARILGTGVEAEKRIISLAMVYLVEGDEAYAERAWRELCCITELSEWCKSVLLDNSAFTRAAAMGYDWLYNYLSEERRAAVSDAICTKGLDIITDIYDNPEKYKTSANPTGASQYGAIFGETNHSTHNNSHYATAALAIARERPRYAAKITAHAMKALEPGFEKMKPDGGYIEGTGYWSFAVPPVARMMSAMKTSIGNMCGYDKRDEILKSAYYPIYCQSSVGNMVFNDMYPYIKTEEQEIYFLAAAAGDRSLADLCVSRGFKGALLPLWYDFREAGDEIKLPKDRRFEGVDVVTMRSTWENGYELFAGFRVGRVKCTHGDVNSGYFAFDALGERWVSAHGLEDYAVEGYWDASPNGKRWEYYCKRAEANNCIVINPSLGPGQNILGEARTEKFESCDENAFAIADLTESYSDYAIKYKRGVSLFDGRQKFKVQDEIELKSESELYWFMNTAADIKISDDKRSAVLTIGDKRVWVGGTCSADFEFSQMKAEPLPTSPNPAGQTDWSDKNKLVVHFGAIKNVTLCVELVPLYAGSPQPEMPAEVIPLDLWHTEDEKTVFADAVADTVAADCSKAMIYYIRPLDKSAVNGGSVKVFDNRQKKYAAFAARAESNLLEVSLSEPSDSYIIEINGVRDVSGRELSYIYTYDGNGISSGAEVWQKEGKTYFNAVIQNGSGERADIAAPCAVFDKDGRLKRLDVQSCTAEARKESRLKYMLDFSDASDKDSTIKIFLLNGLNPVSKPIIRRCAYDS